MVKVTIRAFEKQDIPKKVEWVNNPENNRFLHYDLPLSIEKTEKWFDAHRNDKSRFDGVIEADGVPVGTIGFLNIDHKNGKAELYIAMGETAYKGRGISAEACRLLLKMGFCQLDLNRIYLFTETGNTAAQSLFEKVGFVREGVIRQDVISHGSYADRVLYGMLKEEWKRSSDEDDYSGSR